jgi:hypothetical protein
MFVPFLERMRPFNDYVSAYVAGTITDAELGEVADFYGSLGFKVKAD